MAINKDNIADVVAGIDLTVPGLHIWRVKNFELHAEPKSEYGHFHSGDSYVSLLGQGVGATPMLQP